jgi:hypothetical protein
MRELIRRVVRAGDHVDRQFATELAEAVGLLPDQVWRYIASGEALEKWGYGANWGIWKPDHQP